MQYPGTGGSPVFFEAVAAMDERELKPGIYDGVSQAVYQSWSAVNHSRLKLFARTAAHARYAMEFPPAPTAALNIGDGCHAAVLEPARFEAEFVGAPKVDRRTKDGKLAWQEFEAANQGKLILPAEDYALC